MQVLFSDTNQDRILQEFVDKQKFKAALDHCEKRLKKGQKGGVHRLRVNHYLISILRDLEAGAEDEEVLDRAAPKLKEVIDRCGNDFECVEAVEQAFKHVGGRGWTVASKSQPHNDELHQAWFDAKVRKGEYHDAAEACMYWRVNSPGKTQTLTMQMALCYYLSFADQSTFISQAAKEKDRDMAVRLLRQAANGTPAKNQKTVALTTSSDLELLVHVFRKAGLEADAIAILDDDSKGLRSSLGSWELARAKIEMLASCNRFKEQWRFCHDIVLDALSVANGSEEKQHWGFGESGDDLLVCKSLVLAAVAISGEAGAAVTDTVTLLSKLGEKGSMNAMFQLAELHHRLNDPEATYTTVRICFEAYASSRHVLGIIPLIDSSHAQRFLEFVDETTHAQCSQLRETAAGSDDGKDTLRKKWAKAVNAMVNNVKAKYQILMLYDQNRSRNAKAHEPLKGLLQELINEAVWIYIAATAAEGSKPPAENGVADDAIIFAALLGVKLWAIGEHSALQQAQSMLEKLLAYSKHNFEALALMIRICLRNGELAKAIGYYTRLDIKNTQNLTESAILFQDISLLWPLTNAHNEFNPQTSLKKMLAWIGQKTIAAKEQLLKCIDENNWPTAIDSLEFGSLMQNSPVAGMLRVEHFRLCERSQEVETLPELRDNLLESASHVAAKCAQLSSIVYPSLDTMYRDAVISLRPPSALWSSEDSFKELFRSTIARDVMRGSVGRANDWLLNTLWSSSMSPNDVAPGFASILLLLEIIPELINPSRKDQKEQQAYLAARFEALKEYLRGHRHWLASLSLQEGQNGAGAPFTLTGCIMRWYLTLDAVSMVQEFRQWVAACYPKAVGMLPSSELLDSLKSDVKKALGEQNQQGPPTVDRASREILQRQNLGPAISALIGMEKGSNYEDEASASIAQVITGLREYVSRIP